MDTQKWNAACDILIEMINRPVDGTLRGEIFDEHCCRELEQARAEVMAVIKGMRV